MASCSPGGGSLCVLRDCHTHRWSTCPCPRGLGIIHSFPPQHMPAGASERQRSPPETGDSIASGCHPSCFQADCGWERSKRPSELTESREVRSSGWDSRVRPPRCSCVPSIHTLALSSRYTVWVWISCEGPGPGRIRARGRQPFGKRGAREFCRSLSGLCPLPVPLEAPFLCRAGLSPSSAPWVRTGSHSHGYR